jgi:hypothetical protein
MEYYIGSIYRARPLTENTAKRLNLKELKLHDLKRVCFWGDQMIVQGAWNKEGGTERRCFFAQMIKGVLIK